jgi:hypothetical protein
MVHDFVGIYQNRLRMENKPVFSAAHDTFLETALHAVFFEVRPARYLKKETVYCATIAVAIFYIRRPFYLAGHGLAETAFGQN